MADDGQQATMKSSDLLAKRPPDNKHRFDQLSKIREVFDKLPDARLELQHSHNAHLEAEVTQGPTQVVIDGDGLRLQQFAMGQQHAQFLAAQRLHMHRAIKSRPHHLCDATRIVAVGLVDLSPQHRPHVPRLDADHRQAGLGKRAKKPLRQRPGFKSYPLEAVDRVRQYRQQSFRLARYLHFPYDPARVVHNADAGLLDRYVQSSKMVHAALLLLMLEAVTTDLVSPSA